MTKRIKIYNYNTVLKDTVDIHYPSIEMVCGSKISCVAWSAFHQSTLASSDYDHTVIVWDAATATKVCFFNYFSSFCKKKLRFHHLINIFTGSKFTGPSKM